MIYRRVNSRSNGIALIIVMLVVVFLTILAGGFAYSIKVETRLAQNTSLEPELEWLGRSGVDFARYIVAQQLMVPNEPYDALTQLWAGGSASTNELLVGLTLADNELGKGSFSVRIVDMERKFNINSADEAILQKAMTVMGIDQAEGAVFIDSLQDWKDGDDEVRFNGCESAAYASKPTPYLCKNSPLDDISELLLINGVSRAMFYGPGSSENRLPTLRTAQSARFSRPENLAYSVGFIDLFTTVSSRQININTATEKVLQLLPDIDETTAGEIVRRRQDEFPFQNVGELINVGVPPQAASRLERYCAVRSLTFEVEVDVQIAGCRRVYVALLRRNNPQNVAVLRFHQR